MKQAHNAWYKRLQTVFEGLGYLHCESEHSVFFKVKNGRFIIVAVYVDDKMIFANSLELINQLKAQLTTEYDLTDLGEVCWILGMEIICN